MSFAQMAARPRAVAEKKPEEVEEVEVPALKEVHLDGLVALKIVKHCQDNAPETITGQLLGLDAEELLEVTNCFPFPSTANSYDDDDAGTEYQIEMMRCLREVNVDAYTVGWYSSAELSSHISTELVVTQYEYQTNPTLSSMCVVIVYDPIKSVQSGVLALKALRLTADFIQLYKKDPGVVQPDVKASGLTYKQIFEEVPLRLVNNPLSDAFLHTVEVDDEVEPAYENLDLASNAFLEKNVQFLSTCMEELQGENGRMQSWVRQNQRRQHQINGYLQRLKMENLQRKAQGEEELPEDLSQFKPLHNPSRLHGLVLSAQADEYVTQVEDFVHENALKVFLMNEMQQAKAEGGAAAE